ncbi:hypothetical protein Q8A67_020488 [Cirrhinus molitorella]|uniref:Uncharacterized protein n=1 Tax=Cirrhinus molitorella TaxID=172907 RepID=A0AA88P8W5_9TELE|nr:hypothetical protein Q8A67_020488 [Cirrhinus molitorella]
MFAHRTLLSIVSRMSDHLLHRARLSQHLRVSFLHMGVQFQTTKLEAISWQTDALQFRSGCELELGVLWARRGYSLEILVGWSHTGKVNGFWNRPFVCVCGYRDMVAMTPSSSSLSCPLSQQGRMSAPGEEAPLTASAR